MVGGKGSRKHAKCAHFPWCIIYAKLSWSDPHLDLTAHFSQ